MVNSFLTVLLVLFLTGNPIAAQQQENRWDKYETRTLDSLVQQEKPSISPEMSAAKKPLLVSAKSFPSKVRLTYLGKSRRLAGERKFLFVTWAKTFKDAFPPNMEELYETEVLFQEGQTKYWIPVQKPLLEFLPKEMNPGDDLIAYVIWIGAAKVKGHWEWLFAMNGFDATEKTQ